jgi:hypothetical protein
MSATSVSVLDSTGTARTLATFTDAAGNQRYQVSGDSSVAHYAGGANQITPVAAIKACFVLAGNATTTVRLKRITISGIATAAGEAKFSIKKCSDAGTLGSATLSSMTSVPLDSGFAAASSTPKYVQTAVYGTEPAGIGTIYTGELNLPATGTGVSGSALDILFGFHGVPAVVLRGTAELVIVDFLAASLQSGAKYSCAFLWSEDAS